MSAGANVLSLPRRVEDSSSVGDSESHFTNPAAFYLNIGDDPMYGEPTLSLPGNVVEVLFAEGAFDEINAGLGLVPGFDQYQGLIVPVGSLGDLSHVSRRLAARYSDPAATHEPGRVNISRHLGERVEHSTIPISASGRELRVALDGIADLADEAARQGVEILADL